MGTFGSMSRVVAGKALTWVLYQASNELRRLVVDPYAKGELSSLVSVLTIASRR
jgi:hypothetical protein